MTDAEAFFADAVKSKTDAAKSNTAESNTGVVGMHVLTDGKRGQVFYALAVATPEKTAVFVQGGELTEAFLKEQMEALAASRTVSAFHLKNMYDFFTPVEVRDSSAQAVSEITGSAVWEHTFDTQVAAYLLNPLKNDYTPEDIASEFLQTAVPSYAERFGKKKVAEVFAEERDALLQYAGALSEIALRAYPVLKKRLEETKMYAPLFTAIEMPLTWVLHAMENEGIIAQRDALKEYGDALTGRIRELEASIHQEAECEFNINSPKQLGEILFDKMHMPYAKKTKTGYSTAADVLEKLAPEFPFVKDILEYRGLTKLKSTYADGLAAFIEEDDRIHTIFHQTITATGRLSSADPNLQNIPTRTDLGRRIRKVFVPKAGCVFTDADYSQIELRILAHMSGDFELIEAYRDGEDIHRITASKVFHVPFEEVTDLQRRNAKAVNFGIVYGISAFGLSEDLSISRKEAGDYIEQYFATYPGIKQYLDESVASAKENGYSVTLFQRRRPIPELKSSNFMQRQFGERVAMNAPIQGTAADIMKIAMLRVFFRLEKEGLKSRMILQVHDELLIETVAGEKEMVARVLMEEMEKSAELKVKLIAECHDGESWYEAK
ncbi:MAG: DNA polymerase I [Lachnospiraceae bacterium]|nr:DNA polymerase I [Lachnospiraceae bacterium]